MNYKGYTITILQNGEALVKRKGIYVNTLDSISSAKYYIDKFLDS